MVAVVKDLYWKSVVKAMCAKEALLSKKEGASHFVEILVAIIIVIAVGLVFKNQIVAFIQTIVGKATTEAQNLF